MSKIKNDGLDQYGAKPFQQQQFGTAGVEGVKPTHWIILDKKDWTLPDDDDDDRSLLLGVVVTVMNAPLERPQTID